MFSCYAFLTFNIVSVETNFSLGYFVIAVLGGYMSIVIVGVVWCTVKGLDRSLRIVCLKRGYRKTRARVQANLRLNHPKRQERLRELRR